MSNDTAHGPTAEGAPSQTGRAESDARLVEGLIRREKESFRQLVSVYQETVANIAYRILGNRDEAQEVAQEVFLSAYRAAAQFRHEASVKTWLCKIAVNKALNRLDYLRKRAKFATLSVDDPIARDESGESTFRDLTPASGESPLEGTLRREQSDIITGELQKLSDHFRTILIMRDIEEMSYGEIAQVLELNIGTVKSRLHRARAELARRLKGKL